MLITHASQLLTLAGGPQSGTDLGRLGIVKDGAVLVRDGLIVEAGPSTELMTRHPEEEALDAQNRVVMPGFVDPHTHAVWAGDRIDEFEMTLEGRSYMDILAAGGGIQATVEATRAASPNELTAQTRERTQAMFRNGTTTAEVKTGYGLETSCELAQLQTILHLNQEGPIELVPTLMPAHAIPVEFKDSPEDYVDLLVNEMLPFFSGWMHEYTSMLPLPFVDVFCEQGVFDHDQTKRILSTAKELGFPLKVHVDEFANLGGAGLAAEMGAVSADHLLETTLEDLKALAASRTAAVVLPCTPFGLMGHVYAPAKEIIASGGLLALATDLNPGTAWCENMQFAIALASRTLGLTPAQAVAAATINAAAAIQRADRVGSIEPGKQADLLILTVDDYRHLAYRFGGSLVQTVIKKGNVYSIPQINPVR